MSIKSADVLMELKAASSTASGLPTKVTTVLFVSLPESTPKSETPSTFLIESVIAEIILLFLPSLKFGTHSTSLILLPEKFVIGNLLKK